MKIKIINKSNNPNPTYSTEGSSGMDIRSNEDITVPAMGRVLVHTGLYMAIPEGYEAQIRPRSGLAISNGITVLNTPGTIDSDYRGEVGVILFNTTLIPFNVMCGDRIAQMVISKYKKAIFEDVESLNETERSTGGFGHSGIN